MAPKIVFVILKMIMVNVLDVKLLFYSKFLLSNSLNIHKELKL